MAKWWHRAKLVFVGVPIMALMLFLFLLTHIAEALCEWWEENKDVRDVLRSEWREGWKP